MVYYVFETYYVLYMPNYMLREKILSRDFSFHVFVAASHPQWIPTMCIITRLVYNMFSDIHK